MGRDETVFAMGAAPPVERRVHPSKTGRVGRCFAYPSEVSRAAPKLYDSFEEAKPRAGLWASCGCGELFRERAAARLPVVRTKKSTYAE